MRKITTLVALVMVLTLLTGCSLFKKAGTEMTTTGAATTFDTIPSQGATVSVNYVGTLEDGTIFDTNIAEEAKKAGTGVYSETRTYSPLTFTVGQGQMIPGFEKGVVGMKKGETKTITIPAAEAYGEPKAELMFTTGSALFAEAGITPVLGQSYNFGGAPAKVTKIDGDKVTLDFNHELAGKTLTFKITVLDIAAAAGNAPAQNDAPTAPDAETAQ